MYAAVEIWDLHARAFYEGRCRVFFKLLYVGRVGGICGAKGCFETVSWRCLELAERQARKARSWFTFVYLIRNLLRSGDRPDGYRLRGERRGACRAS